MPARRRAILFAHTAWDAIPVVCDLAQLAGVLAWFWFFPELTWPVRILLGVVYAISISWNINGISHNLIHNPYFRWPLLNRLFCLIESVTLGFSQTFYKAVHLRHHVGNSDRPDAGGSTIDWLSIYRHGHDGKPESVWSYTFLSFFRDDPKAIYREIARKRKGEARWGLVEIVSFLAFFAAMGIVHPWFLIVLLPSWYLGHCLSYLNGYFEHYAGDPDTPIAWGVSTYHRLYNLLWFNNGYHAEHHYRPRTHWTRMGALHKSIERQQQEAGTRVIRPPHALGFLDPDLPSRDDLPTPPPPAPPAAAEPAVVVARSAGAQTAGSAG